VQPLEGDEDPINVVIVDRTLLSRAAFLLHRGVGVEGTRFSLNEMYPDNLTVPPSERIDLDKIVPDVIFDLQVSSPQQLLERLDPNDPKYTFRARNIRGGFRPARIASSHLPKDIEERVFRIDGEKTPEAIFERVLDRLGAVAIFGAARSSL
jgi:thymidylate kinase